MRDHTRIYRIIKAVEAIWELNPDLRFFQLIESLGMGKFYQEDDVTEKELDEILRKLIK